MSTHLADPIPTTHLRSLRAPRMGLGCMGMTLSYGPRDRRQGIATIHRALDRGVHLLDTADMYAGGRNERLVRAAITGRRDEVVIATKCGITTWPIVGLPRGRRADPAYIRRSVRGSLRRLGLDVIDLYYLHRADPRIPIEDSIGTMGELVTQGLVREIGVSEVTPDELARAHATYPLAALQLEWSLLTRDDEVVSAARDLGIGLVAYSPISRGLLSGDAAALHPGRLDYRRHLPRWSAANLPHNIGVAHTVAEIAARHEATAAQVALAWLLAQGDDVVPIPGTSRPGRIDENLGAFAVRLTDEDLRILSGLRAAGERYSRPGGV